MHVLDFSVILANTQSTPSCLFHVFNSAEEYISHDYKNRFHFVWYDRKTTFATQNADAGTRPGVFARMRRGNVLIFFRNHRWFDFDDARDPPKARKRLRAFGGNMYHDYYKIDYSPLLD